MQDFELWILLFDSIHRVIAAEDFFRASSLWCDLVPVPRELSSNCGMALVFRAEEIDAVRRILSEGRISPRQLFRPSPAGYVEASELLLNHG